MTVSIILVTVSRSYRLYAVMRKRLGIIYFHYPHAVLRHGNCYPGDVHAAGFWKRFGGADDPWDADWPTCVQECKPGHRGVNRRGEEYCPSAGHRRDARMVESAPDLGVAFLDPKSRTKGAIKTAERMVDAGIPTLVYRQGISGVETHNVGEDLGVLL